MANSASDARSSELELRRQLIEDRSVDVIIAVGTNMFYTVTLPVTLWFLDRGKRNTDRADQVLFVDARKIYNQLDRAHRDWTPPQIEFLVNIVRLWRDEDSEFNAGSQEMLTAAFPDRAYGDVAGLCCVATLDEIQEQGWSLNPGRYVGTSAFGYRRHGLRFADSCSSRGFCAVVGRSPTPYGANHDKFQQITMIKSRLAELGRIVTGSTPSRKEPHLFGSDVPFLTPSDMAFDRRNVPTERGISAAGAARFKTRLLPSRAVSVVCIGATIGKTCMTDGPVLTNQQINSIVGRRVKTLTGLRLLLDANHERPAESSC